MTNFKEETLGCLERNGKSLDNIKWIGNKNGYIPIEDFFKNSDFEYDSGYGSQDVACDIVITGDDFIMTRGEYDGSEWWNYMGRIDKPTRELEKYKLYGGMWAKLEDIDEC